MNNTLLSSRYTNPSEKVAYLCSIPGVMGAAIRTADSTAVRCRDGHAALEPVLHAAFGVVEKAEKVSSKPPRILFGTKTIGVKTTKSGSIAVAFETGHPIAKSLARMLRRLLTAKSER